MVIGKYISNHIILKTMKKLILIFVAIASCTMAANAQQRTILYEEFTGENCNPCAAANPGLEALMAANPGKILHVTFMEPVPTTGFFYKSTLPLDSARFGCTAGSGYYAPVWSSWGSCFTPSGFMDGHLPDSTTPASIPCGNCGNVASFVQADIDKEYTVPSPLKISAIHYFNAARDSVFGIVTVTEVTPITVTQLKLRAAFVRTMDFATAPGTNGETHFENVARNMFPSELGQSIASTWTAGTTHTYTYSGKCAGLDALTGVTTADSSFIVWVQNDTAGGAVDTRFNVLQAAKSVYRPGALNIGTVIDHTYSLNVYPNPAREVATLSFSLLQTSDVQVKVIDDLGRTLNTISKTLGAGEQKIDLSTTELPSGLYTIRMDVNSDMVTQRLSVIK